MPVVPLDERTASAWVALFDACGCPCFCRYWHFEGTKNDWLERTVQRAGDNRDDQLALLGSGAPEAAGLLAMDGSVAVGWMKLAPRARLPKLRRQGAYRPLDLGPDEGVWSIGCLLVHPLHRRRGVARALVTAAPNHIRASRIAGQKLAIEAYPRGGSFELHDEEAWMGTTRLFESCGFERVAGESAYPVMRMVV